MVPELKAEFPDHAPLIAAYASRFNETIPGPMPGSLELVERPGAAGGPLFAITTFGPEFWEGFRPPHPIFHRIPALIPTGPSTPMTPDPPAYAPPHRPIGNH